MKIKYVFMAFGAFQKPQHLLPYKNAKLWLNSNCPKDVLYGSTKEKINCEHVIPRSLLRKKKHPETDLHCLVLSNAKLNSHRQNYGFGTISGTNTILLDSFGRQTCIIKNATCKKDIKNQRFEPPNEQKGRIARIVGYYIWTYHGGEILPGLMEKKSMLQWHSKYPVSSVEVNKNYMVYKIQKNKNIFICYPLLMPIFFSTPVLFLRKCLKK